MIAAMATWEREEISARVAASVPIRAQMGKSTGGAATFGYEWKDGKLLVNDKEAPVRKLVYELFIEHRRRKIVARILNERGYRTRNGSAWSDTTIERLLRDPTAKGTRRANYTQTKNPNGAWELKPQDDWILVPVEPIVSEETWAAANAILNERQARGTRQTKPVTHLFAGVAGCVCGSKMYVPSNSPKYTCSKCRNKIPVKDLEAIFKEELRAFVFSPDEIFGHVQAGNEQVKSFEELITSMEAEQKKLTSDADKLIELYQGNLLDKKAFGQRYEKLRGRLEQVGEELPQLQAKRDVLKIALTSREEVLSGSKDLVERWDTLEHPDRRQVVEAILERVVVGNGEVEFNFLYNPGFASSPNSQHASG
jgi:site-specific DNA recombinase